MLSCFMISVSAGISGLEQEIQLGHFNASRQSSNCIAEAAQLRITLRIEKKAQQ